jgi:hypothetical protein
MSDISGGLWGPPIYTIWRITTLADGRYQVDGEWNDDNDDGVPDGETTHWSQIVDTREQALRITGVTRTGWYGHQVTVSLDGAMVTVAKDADVYNDQLRRERLLEPPGTSWRTVCPSISHSALAPSRPPAAQKPRRGAKSWTWPGMP